MKYRVTEEFERHPVESKLGRIFVTVTMGGLLLTSAWGRAAGAQQTAYNTPDSMTPALATSDSTTPASATAASPTAPSAAVRGVRLSEVKGAVRLLQSTQILTEAASVNTTLYEGTQVAAGTDGRAEIQLEDGSILRLTPNSTLTLNKLQRQGDGTETEIELNGGMAYFELHSDTDSHKLRVRFGDAVVTSSAYSIVRISLDKAPGSMTVFAGDAHLERPHVGVDVRGGESVQLSASDPSQFDLTKQIEPDSWDQWNTDRDAQLTSATEHRTTATAGIPDGDNPAWSDLDANGSWYDLPGQGQVWSPTEAAYAGWDPYGSGSWDWTPQFGYSWISAEPWGYLPYRCGLWNYYDSFGWGWMPGYGGCNPWFGSGFWFVNIGYFPHRYHLPTRPRGGPIARSGSGSGVMPRVVVNHNSFQNGHLIRPVSGTATIGGQTVQPLRPVSRRVGYGQAGGPGNPSGSVVRPGGTGSTGTGSGSTGTRSTGIGTGSTGTGATGSGSTGIVGSAGSPPRSTGTKGLPGYPTTPPVSGSGSPGSRFGSMPPRSGNGGHGVYIPTPPVQPSSGFARPGGMAPRSTGGYMGNPSSSGSAPPSHPVPSRPYSGGGFSGGGFSGGGSSGGSHSGGTTIRR